MKRALDAGEEWEAVQKAGLSFSQSCGAIKEILPAATIVEQLVHGCADVLRRGASRL